MFFDIIFLVIIMYCRKCGRKLKGKETYCDYCGQGKEDIVLTGDEKKDAAAQMDYGSIGAMCIVISIIIPPIGLIMAIIYLCTMGSNKTLENKEKGKKRFIISILISLAWIIIPMLAGICRLIISYFFK